MPLYEAAVVRIIAPHIIECAVSLGFGVHMLKRFCLSRPFEFATVEKREAAMRAMIVLCGRKQVLLEVTEGFDTQLVRSSSEGTPYEAYTLSKLYTEARQPPQRVQRFMRQKMWVEVGEYLTMLEAINFDIDTVKQHLNGKRNHAST